MTLPSPSAVAAPAAPPERAPEPGARPRPRTLLAWAALAFVAAALLRLPLVNEGLFHHDEVVLARAVERSLAEGELHPAVKGRYGAVLLGLSFYAPYHLLTGGTAEPVVPLLGIFWGAVLVAALLLLAHELTGDRLASALAAAFAGTGTLFLTTSSTGKENVPQLAFVVVACLLLSRGARTGSPAARLAALALISFALAIHEGGALLVPPLALFTVAVHLAHRRPRKALALDLAGLAAAVAIPVAISIGGEILRNLRTAGSNSTHFLGLFSPILPEALRDAPLALGAAPLTLAAVGLFRAVASRDRALLGLAPWLLVFAYFANVSSYAPRYLSYVIPPVALLGGVGGAWVVRRVARRGARAAIAAALVAAAALPGVGRALPLLVARAAHSGPKAWARLVAARTEADAIVLCMDDSVFVEYYARRRALTHPIDDPAATAAFVHDLKRRVQRGERLYLGASAFTYDRWDHFKGLVEAAFVLVPVGQVVNEWHHRPELEDFTFDDVLYRLALR